MVEGFGSEIDIADYTTLLNQAGVTPAPAVLLPFTYTGIPGGQTQTVLFKPISGLFSQNKYIY